MNLSDWIWGGVGLLLSVMVLSYLIGDNFLFRFAAYLFVGVTAGYLTVLIINQILGPYLFQPMMTATWLGRLWLVVPLVLIVLLVLSQFPRFAGVGSLPLAFLAGLTAAIAIGGAVFGTLIPQSWAVVEAFDPVVWYAGPRQIWWYVLDAGVILIGTVATLSYFHFGQKSNPKDDGAATERPKVFEVLSKAGQVFIGITLGAVFAGVFSTALIALIERILFINEIIFKLLGGG